MIKLDNFMKKSMLSLILSVICLVANAQQIVVSGKVLDSNTKEALVGATVIVEGTTKGAVTGVEGDFALSVDAETKLVISYVGYLTETIEVQEEGVVNVELSANVLKGEEVVVVGYGTQKRSSLSTVVSTLKLDDTKKNHPTDLLTALQGQIAGVTISSNSGDPLSSASVVIRGQGSRGGDPILYIVDGVPGAPYNDQDVETITVLKDAAAAAIYGANVGSGGVVVITTKKAQAGKTIVTAKTQFGIQQATNLPTMLSASEYNMIRTDAAAISGTSLPTACDESYYPWGSVTRTDWLDEIFRVGTMQNYAFSVSGGNDVTTSMMSLEYRKTEGTLLNTYKNELGVNLNVSFKPAKWLTISQRLNYKYSNGQGNVSNSGHTGVIASAMFYPRSATVYEMNQDGSYALNSDGQRYYGGTVPTWASDLGVAGTYGEVANPVATLMRLNQNRPSNTLYSTTTVEVKPISGLTIKSDLTANGSFDWYDDFTSMVTEIGKTNLQNSRTISSSIAYGYLSETVASYEKYLDKHHISVMGGLSVDYDQYRSTSTTVYDFDDESETSQAFINGSDWSTTKPTESFSELSSLGMFARASYSYDDRFFATASVRRDASSKLYINNNSGVFPAFSGAWKLSSEKFMQNQEVVDVLKARVSWGKIGNVSSVNNYSYVSSLAASSDLIYLGNNQQNPIQGVGLESFANLDLTWETSEQTNFGVDLTFLDHRLNVTADYYVKKTKDLIEEMSIPSVAGLMTAPYGNVGEVRNRGLEFSATYADVTATGLSYVFSGNVSFQKNEVTSLGDMEYMAHSNVIRAMYPLRSTVGESWYSYYLVKTDGIFQTQDEIDAYTYTDASGNTSLIQPNAQPGDLKFVDYNNDGQITEAGDSQYMGSYTPKVTYGFTVSLAYKGFDFSMQFQGVAGNKIFNGVKLMTYNPAQGWNMSADVLDSWGYNNNSDIALLSMSDLNGNMSTASDYFLENGSYLRVKNLTIGYNIPKKVFSNDKNVNARVYFSSENVFTFTKYGGMDPEVGNYGIDGGTYPVSRIFSLGISITL